MHVRSCAVAVLGLLVAGAGAAALGGESGPAGERPEPVIRVGLLVDVAEAKITCDGPLRVWRRGSGLRGSQLEAGSRLTVAAAVLPPTPPGSPGAGGAESRRGLQLRDERRGPLGLFAEDLVLESLSPGVFLEVNGRAYRGEVVVVPRPAGGLTVINAVYIEDYLRGVVPAELGRGAGVPDAALQAQAIAARSYTLYYLRRHAVEGFDLVAGPADQVYEGVAIETPGADAALRATRGVVATYAGRPIRANYSSTCGGRTAASGSAWPGEDFAYLQSVKDRVQGKDACSASPHYRWTEEWPAESFEVQLLANLCRELPEAQAAGPTKIERLEIRGRTSSGRVEALAIHTDRGCFVVRGNRIRWVLQRADGTPLRSTILGKLERRSEGGRKRYVLHGAGYGHGVGLCQYGAMGLAQRGASARQILGHYYRGIALARWW